MRTLIAFLMILSFASCKKADDKSESADWTNKIKALYIHNESKLSISEGIWGTITRRDGNCMPVVDSAHTTCKEIPAQRSVYVYEYTTIKDINGSMKNFTAPATQLKAVIKTDAEGFYELKIAPGTYSIFVEENGTFYAGYGDGNGGLNPVTVIAGQVSTGHIVLDYAVY